MRDSAPRLSKRQQCALIATSLTGAGAAMVASAAAFLRTVRPGVDGPVVWGVALRLGLGSLVIGVALLVLAFVTPRGANPFDLRSPWERRLLRRIDE